MCKLPFTYLFLTGRTFPPTSFTYLIMTKVIGPVPCVYSNFLNLGGTSSLWRNVCAGEGNKLLLKPSNFTAQLFWAVNDQLYLVIPLNVII